MGRFNAVLTATSDNYDFCERPVSPLSSTRNGHGAVCHQKRGPPTLTGRPLSGDVFDSNLSRMRVPLSETKVSLNHSRVGGQLDTGAA
jgi:hypothetical protein